MSALEKLKGQIEALKTANQAMKKQIEIQSRTIDLLGSMIIEPHEVEECPTHGANDASYIERFTDEQL